MDYIVSKDGPRLQYRIYIDGKETDGKLVYKGHKLGVDENTLSEILDYRIERSTNKIHFLKYDKIEDSPDYLDLNQWKIGRIDSMNIGLLESWMSLNNKMQEKFGKFRKIIITKVNL